MRTTAAIAACIGVAVLGLILGSAVVNALDPIARAEAEAAAALRAAQREALAPWVLALRQVGVVALGIGLLAGAAAAIAGAVMAWAGAAKQRNGAALVYAEHGLYPAVVQPAVAPGRGVLLSAASPVIGLLPPPNEPRAQVVAALTNGNLDRIPAGAMRPILRPTPDEALLPELDAGPSVLTLDDATRVNPQVSPHWLMIGRTGSGKSNAMRHVLTLQAQRYTSEFVICEPQRGNWKDAANAWTVVGIAQAIHAVYLEQLRRAELLAAHPTADHVMQLPGVELSYLCLLFAEMDATMDNLYRLDRGLHRQTLVELRDIARMGRKEAVCLFAESQSGLADILDSNIARNFANVFLFNGSQQTAKNLGVSDLVNLPKLPVGVAFSLTHEATVEFVPLPRPRLPRSQLYQEPELLPAENATETVTENATVAVQDESGVWRVEELPAVALPGATVAPAVAPNFDDVSSAAQLDAQQRAHIIAVWEKWGRLPRRSLRKVENEIFGYPGGRAHDVIAPVIREYYADRGETPPWEVEA